MVPAYSKHLLSIRSVLGASLVPESLFIQGLGSDQMDRMWGQEGFPGRGGALSKGREAGRPTLGKSSLWLEQRELIRREWKEVRLERQMQAKSERTWE